jgi:hypothetical protein
MFPPAAAPLPFRKLELFWFFQPCDAVPVKALKNVPHCDARYDARPCELFEDVSEGIIIKPSPDLGMNATLIDRRLRDLIQIFIVIENAGLLELRKLPGVESLTGVMATRPAGFKMLKLGRRGA